MLNKENQQEILRAVLNTQNILGDRAELSLELEVLKLLNPKLSVDGNMFCYLLGDNLGAPESIAGFGETPGEALRDFVKNYRFGKAKRADETKNPKNITEKEVLSEHKVEETEYLKMFIKLGKIENKLLDYERIDFSIDLEKMEFTLDSVSCCPDKIRDTFKSHSACCFSECINYFYNAQINNANLEKLEKYISKIISELGGEK